ncbi:alpha/beta hydrolase [Streptomyces sp. CBMA156]|uniref:alpha/beta hydrolase n=1 Tax=Streptomyces sp. CBMA156 TaxID=1930280 RepID=UPI001661BDB9|nr:alpha/beta hydrolase [Streptomyces sp. CBMA156]MBD0673374.1 alpha/beta hydrolase [Streptomyces sp. CBMA156]
MSARNALTFPTRHSGDPGRVALIVPGTGYSPARPLLHFARSVLLGHGWTVQELWWQLPEEFVEFAMGDRIAWVERQVTGAVDAERGACRLLVGKSLASFASAVTADRNLPAAWLTPVLTVDHVARALHRTEAPTLLVGGGADRLWDRPTAHATGHEVLELPGADHGLEHPGDPLGSVDALRQVVARLDGFVASLAAHRVGPFGAEVPPPDGRRPGYLPGR